MLRANRIFAQIRPCLLSIASLKTFSRKNLSIVCGITPCMHQMRFCSEKKNCDQDFKEAKKYLLDRVMVKQRVMDVVKNFEKVDASKVTETSHFIDDLNLDSLDVVEVVMALEQEFVLDMPDHDAERISTIAEAIEYIATNPLAK